MLVSAVEHLSVGQLGWRQSGRDGLAGDGQRQRRVEVAGHHSGQRAEHGAELVRRSLLLGERLISHMVVLTEEHVGEKNGQTLQSINIWRPELLKINIVLLI